MHGKAILKINRTRARSLALAVLFCIFNGATFELVHRHGDFTGRNVLRLRAEIRSIGSDEANGSLKNPAQNFQCLICQLHRNMADGLVSPALLTSGGVKSSAPMPPAALAHFNISLIATRGRAPPSSLSS
jgi:hypothetical protein